MEKFHRFLTAHAPQIPDGAPLGLVPERCPGLAWGRPRQLPIVAWTFENASQQKLRLHCLRGNATSRTRADYFSRPSHDACRSRSGKAAKARSLSAAGDGKMMRRSHRK